MKKFFTLITLALFTATAAFAQENILTEETAHQEVKPYKVYCEIVSYVRGLFSNKTNVELDFGHYASWWILDRQLGSTPASADRNQDLVLNPSSAALRTEMATLDARIDKPN